MFLKTELFENENVTIIHDVINPHSRAFLLPVIVAFSNFFEVVCKKTFDSFSECMKTLFSDFFCARGVRMK